MAESLTQATVLQALRSIQDPDLHRDNVSLGFVKDGTTSGGKVALTMERTRGEEDHLAGRVPGPLDADQAPLRGLAPEPDVGALCPRVERHRDRPAALGAGQVDVLGGVVGQRLIGLVTHIDF